MLLLPKAGRRLSGLWGAIDRSGRCARWLQVRERRHDACGVNGAYLWSAGDCFKFGKAWWWFVGLLGHVCDPSLIVSRSGGRDDGWGVTRSVFSSSLEGLEINTPTYSHRLETLWCTTGLSELIWHWDEIPAHSAGCHLWPCLPSTDMVDPG